MTEDDRAAVERELGNRYQIVRTLGAGAFAAVYLAREQDLHRLVAIKVLRGDRAWSDDERERLLREARTIANLSHPAVVPLLAFGPGIRPARLGTRASFADLGQTIAEGLGVARLPNGESFLDALHGAA